jgi:hypothetical protein
MIIGFWPGLFPSVFIPSFRGCKAISRSPRGDQIFLLQRPDLPPSLKLLTYSRMQNPYQTSGSADYYSTPSDAVTASTYQALAATKPWVRLCSVMGFIGAAFMILGGIAMIVGGAVAGSRSSGAMAGLPAGMGIVYLLMSLLYLIPSIKLWKYGSAIVRLISSRSTADLDQAMNEQRGFWQFVGIMMLIMIVLMGITMLLALFGAAVAAA